MLAYAACMRANGVPSFPDPDASGGIKITASIGDSPGFKSAQPKCEKLLPASTPAQREQIEKRLLAYSACMRSHGVPSFPDPTVSGKSIGIRLNDLDPNTPQFRAAQAACRRYLPGFGS